MINNTMRLNEVITENHVRQDKDQYSVTDADEFDKTWNPEAQYYAELEKQRKGRLWDEAGGGIPVVTKDEPNDERRPFTNTPEQGELESPGFRGEQEARDRVGADHKRYQKYDPQFMKPEDPLAEL